MILRLAEAGLPVECWWCLNVRRYAWYLGIKGGRRNGDKTVKEHLAMLGGQSI